MPVADLATAHRAGTPLRTIWFGMRCAFMQAALEGALTAGEAVTPVAVVVPRGPQPLGAGWPEPPFDRWLHERGVGVIEVERLGGGDLRVVTEAVDVLEIELGVGACFPWKVPSALRERLPHGALNIHPSLLPALRGPEPVFHAYRLGLAESGVTVHLMDDGWDSGPVVARERVPVPEAGDAATFEAELARRGGRLLAALAHRWRSGELRVEPQDDSAATFAPAPTDADRVIPATMTVAQATRFIDACAPLVARDADAGLLVTVSGVADAAPVGRETRGLVRVSLRDGTLWFRRIPRGG